MQLNIRSKLMLGSISGVALLVITLSTSIYYIAQENVQLRIVSHLQSVGEARASHIQSYLEDKKKFIRVISSSTPFIEWLRLATSSAEQHKPAEIKLQTQLRFILNSNFDYYEVTILDSQGRVIESTDPNQIGLIKSTDPAFIFAQDGVFIQGPHLDKLSKETVLSFSGPVVNPNDNSILGVVIIRSTTNSLYQITTNRSGLGDSGEVYLVDQNKLLISPSRFLSQSVLKLKIDTASSRSAIERYKSGNTRNQTVINTEQRPLIYTDYRGIEVIGTNTLIPGVNWACLAEIDTAEAFATIAQMRLAIMLIGACFIFIFMIAAYLYASSITQPIRILQEGAKRLGAGEWEYRLRITTGDEIEQLARSFNQMSTKLSGFYATLEDKVAERTLELEQSNQELSKLSRAIEQSYNAVMITDTFGIIQYVNPRFSQITGYSREETIGLHSNFLRSEPSSQNFHQELWETISRGNNWQGVFCNSKKNGEKYWEQASISPVRNKQGKIANYVSVMEDVTEQRRVAKALKQAKEAAEAANKSKSDFLANMSHEIRTPMNAVIGMSDLLAATNLDTTQRKYLDTFQRAGENLLEIINDVLDFSKIESGQLILYPKNFNLEELANNTVDFVAIEAHKKELELNCYLAPNLPLDLNGDSTRLRQIMTNMLKNAIKFTEKGRILLYIEQESRITATKTRLIFTIQDSGIGMSPTEIVRIFDQFSQADSSITRAYGGTGLGLSIAKQLVKLMHGRISVSSQLSVGSTFTFTAELDLQADTPTNNKAQLLKMKRILVADTYPDNCDFLKNLFQHSCSDIVTATTTAELATQLASAASAPFDLICCDHSLAGQKTIPILLNAAKSLKTLAKYVLLTSSKKVDIPEQICQQLNITEQLVKPLHRAWFYRILNKANGPALKATPKAALPAPTEFPDLRILLVDDTKDNRLLILAYFKKYPFQVMTAENGQIAVDKFINGEFDLVFMDMQMPVLDGYNATIQIRQWEQEQQRLPTTIVALTAYALEEEVQKSLDAGCNEHLTKPVKKKTLLTTILKYLPQIEST